MRIRKNSVILHLNWHYQKDVIIQFISKKNCSTVAGKGLKTKINLVAITLIATILLYLNNISPSQKTRSLFLKWLIMGAKAENEQEEPGISYHTKRQGSHQRLLGSRPKHSGAHIHVRKLLSAKCGIISASVRVITAKIKAHHTCLNARVQNNAKNDHWSSLEGAMEPVYYLGFKFYFLWY